MIKPTASIKHSFLLVLLLSLVAGLVVDTQADNYVIGGRDLLKVTIYEHPDLAAAVRVEEDGNISLPLIGAVRAEGLTTPALEREVARLYANGFIINPQVSIYVAEYRSQKVSILGEVNRPGLYEISGITTLLEVIAQAQGLTREAADRLVITMAAPDADTPGNRVTREINLKRLLKEGDVSQNVHISDGYVLFVPKADMFYIHGEVKAPGYYKIEEGATYLKAIVTAGGVTSKTAEQRTEVTRKVDGMETTVKVNLGDVVKPGDIIRVPESYFYIYGEVSRPGYYKLEDGMTFLRAIVAAGGFTNKAAESRVRCTRAEDGAEAAKRVILSDMVRVNDVIYVPESIF